MTVIQDAATISNRLNLLADWQEKAKALRELKIAEMEIRKAVVDAFSDAEEFPEDASGTENIDIGQGYDLKILHKLDYKLDTTNDCAALNAALQRIENSMEGGAILAERLVKWKPELSISEYNKLPNAQRAMIDKVLTVKPATKSLEIKLRGK